MKKRVSRGSLSRRLAGVLIGTAFLIAGCGGETPQTGRTDTEIQFGIWFPDEQGAMRFKATADVPNEEDQAYGWRVRVAESEEAIRWVESITLPEAPESWEGVEENPNVMISEDGRTATSVGLEVPDGGYLENWWYVAVDDPPGDYEMSVELSDGRKASFRFRLGDPVRSLRDAPM